MNSLRFLLVHRNPAQSEEIAAQLARANHSVLPAPGFEAAAEALGVERFDAVLMESEFRNRGLQEFSARLRQMEQGHRGAARIPVIALADDVPVSLEAGLDGVITQPIDPEKLTAEVTSLAQALAASSGATADDELGILDLEKFREQVGFDDELMMEIIDLFMGERKRQETEMQDALMAKQFDVLMRVAHTMKGSLSSLHAMRARAHAHQLEMAAKIGDEDVCWTSLAALENDLVELEPELLALR